MAINKHWIAIQLIDAEIRNKDSRLHEIKHVLKELRRAIGPDNLEKIDRRIENSRNVIRNQIKGLEATKEFLYNA